MSYFNKSLNIYIAVRKPLDVATMWPALISETSSAYWPLSVSVLTQLRTNPLTALEAMSKQYIITILRFILVTASVSVNVARIPIGAYSVRCNRFRPIDVILDNVRIKDIGISHSNELSLSELLDMNYHEMQRIAGLSSVDVIRLVNYALHSFCIGNSSSEEYISRCSQHFPSIIATEQFESIKFADQSSLSLLINCLNESNRTHDVPEIMPDLSVAYSIPDAVDLYQSRNWVVSVTALESFRGEQHYNQRRAFQEVLFLMRRYGGNRGLVEPVFVFHPRNSSLYETLHHYDPTLLSRLSTSNASSGRRRLHRRVLVFGIWLLLLLCYYYYCVILLLSLVCYYCYFVIIIISLLLLLLLSLWWFCY